MHSYFIAEIQTTFYFHRNVARHYARVQMQNFTAQLNVKKLI
jgi:hypothetical protein